MQKTGKIISSVLGGLVFLGAAGGTFWWLQSRTATRDVGQEIPVPQIPETTAPPSPAPVSQSPQPSIGMSAWAPVALPAGSVKIEQGSSTATMTEPGIVRFDVQTGESIVWHWPRTLAKHGATPFGDWAGVNGDYEVPDGLLVQLSTGNAYRFKGRLLWMGPEGALFKVAEGDRQRLILTDTQMKPVSERWLPKEYAQSYDWQREDRVGWFRFRTKGATAGSEQYHRISMLTGGVESAGSPATQGLWLEQTSLFPGGCGGDGGGNLVKVHQGEKVLWTVLDGIAPQTPVYKGSRLLADGSSALVGTIDGPALLRLADGTLQPSAELKALGSPYLYASPTSPVEVAADPDWQGVGSYLLRVARLGQAGPYRTFDLKATKSEQNVDIQVDSGAYWSPDGRYLQLAVHYPDAGGKCGSGDDLLTLLAPVVVKGEWKGPLQVQTKAAVTLYSATQQSGAWRMGAPVRTVAAGERLTVKGAGPYPKPYIVVEGDGILLADPSQLEWVHK